MRRKVSGDLLQVEFVCPDCNRHLGWALPTAEIICPDCGKWVNNENRKKIYEVYLPADSEQTVLFK